MGGNCESVVSQEVVDELKLASQDHPHPYKLSWFKKGNEVKVSKRCLVPFSIRKKYFDEAWCDVVPMDACISFLEGLDNMIAERLLMGRKTPIPKAKITIYFTTNEGQCDFLTLCSLFTCF